MKRWRCEVAKRSGRLCRTCEIGKRRSERSHKLTPAELLRGLRNRPPELRHRIAVKASQAAARARAQQMDFGAAVERIRAELAARPPFLTKLFDRTLEVLERRPKQLTELHGLQLLPTYAERRRVEPRLPMRRQAIALVLGALYIETDLCSLRSGHFRGDGTFSGRGQEWIAELTGLSLWRVRRAIWDLVAAGYLSAKQPIEPYLGADPNGGVGPVLRHCAHFTIYRFELRWFDRIVYDKRLKRERASAAERRKSRTRMYGASLVRARHALRKLRTSNSATPRPRPPTPAARPPSTSR